DGLSGENHPIPSAPLFQNGEQKRGRQMLLGESDTMREVAQHSLISKLLRKLRRYFGSSSADQQAFTVWGDRARERQDSARPILAWTDSLIVSRRYVHPAISGRPDGNWLDWAADRFFQDPVELS